MFGPLDVIINGGYIVFFNSSSNDEQGCFHTNKQLGSGYKNSVFAFDKELILNFALD